VGTVGEALLNGLIQRDRVEDERKYLAATRPEYPQTLRDARALCAGRPARVLEIDSFLGVFAFSLAESGYDAHVPSGWRSVARPPVPRRLAGFVSCHRRRFQASRRLLGS
jgi:hypothetical protein